MSDKLTLRQQGSLESKFSTRSDSAGEDDNYSPSPDKGAFFSGVRKGIRKLGSVGGPSRPVNTQIRDRSATATPDSALRSTGFERYHGKKHDRSTSDSNREKPLPQTPLLPPVEELLQNPFGPLDTFKVFESMSRPAMSGSRTSTMDSSTSGASIYAGGFKSASNTYLADMSSSQGSLASSSTQEGEDETKDIITPRSNGPPSAGPSPAQPRSAGGPNVGTPGGSSSTHLSGLMCNVHQTTGREPHPLVGATTTILGDKLYVFGGRILSRTRPALTSDLYELDLVRRHWTKIDTTGDVPPPRYFHSVCPLGDKKLVCYGGMSPAPSQGPGQPNAAEQNAKDAQPEVVVMSDIYIYDAPTKTWSFIPTQDTPQGRYAHCATMLPSSATFSSVNAVS